MNLVGRYELLSPLLSGALGELWLARIASGPEEGRVVDIRRIPRSAGLEMRFVERITNAGFAAMELRHPRIAAVLDVVVGAAEIAIVSEHITGAILQTLVRPQPGKRVSVPIGVASRIALDLLEAVDALKAPWDELFPSADTPEELLLRSGVHGGLVPDGLLIATFGETMLLESGLAGVALTIPAIVDHPDVIAYRAPEQLEPGRTIDERADVFTVGILLWEMIAGRSLFGPSLLPRPGAPSSPTKTGSAGDPIQVSAARRKVLSHPVPRLDSLPLLKGNVKKGLADFVARCLERDPGLRFQTARDAISAFAALDATSLSRHDAVVKLVSSLGISESHGAPPEEPAGPSSNRPTAPPEEPGGVASGPADTERNHAESELPPSTDIESLPPSEPPPDSVPVMGSDVESIPPVRATTADSVPVLGDDVESIPPSSRDLDTLPPPSAATIAKTEFAGVEGSITLMSGTASPSGPTEPVAAVRPAAEKPDAGPYPIDAGAVGAVTAAAPVVRMLDSAQRLEPGRQEAETPEPRFVEDPVSSERRDRSRRIVVGIMAAAAVLMLIAMLRAAFSGGSTATPSASSNAAATQAVASSVSPSSATIETPPETVPSAAAQHRAAAPTSAPGGSTVVSAEGSSRKQQNKKRAFRPSGI
jgi:serine/threonine protein kinase